MPTYRLIIGDRNLSSWSLRVWLLLRQFELPFELVTVDLDQPDTRDKILAYSPGGRVPILQTRDQTIWESLAIIEFVAENHPDLLIWPRDAALRARARVLAAEMHAGFTSLRDELSFNCQARVPMPSLSMAAKADVKRMTDIWREARQVHQGSCQNRGDFLFGPFSAADAMFAPVAVRFNHYSVPLDDTCRAYVEALLQLPNMVAWMADAGVA
ncbi:MAG: glutathione S-transferase family protein [Proteobacteria bacterium]|nr:glutathione S-transferase family protein [Pseudomonadota bacterium]